MRRLLPFLALAAVALAPGSAAAATSSLPADPQRLTSELAPAGRLVSRAEHPALAYDRARDRFLAVWTADGAARGETEVYGRLLDGAGAPLASTFRISSLGPDGDVGYDASEPDVAFDPTSGRYLVVWRGNDDAPGLAQTEREIYGQLVSADGLEVGPDDLRISITGPDGDARFDVGTPTVAADPARGRFLVAWTGEHAKRDDNEVAVRLVLPDGSFGGPRTVVSSLGDGSGAFDAEDAAVAFDADRDRYLVVWAGDDSTPPLADNEREIFGQLLSGDLVEVGPDDARLSDMGPDGSAAWDALAPDVAVDSIRGRFLVVWFGDDDASGLADNEREVFGQLVSDVGDQVGPNDARLSDMGPDGVAGFDAFDPAAAYDAVRDRFLVAWWGDDASGTLVDNEREIFAQLVDPELREDGVDERVSEMGPDGDRDYDGFDPVVASGGTGASFLIAWWGDDATPPLGNQQYAVFSRRLLPSSAPFTPPGSDVPTAPGTSGATTPLRLTARGRATQRPSTRGRIVLRVRCSTACVVRIQGKVILTRDGRGAALTPRVVRLAAGKETPVSIALRARTLTRIGEANAAGIRARAVLRVAATDDGGTRVVRRKVFRLLT